MREAVVTAQVTGIQAMRAASATVEPLRIEEIPAQMLADLMPVQVAEFQKSNGAVTLNDLRASLTQYQQAAHTTDLAMQQAEAKGDVAAMEALAAKEQTSRDAFYISTGLLQNSYYHTIDRIFTSFPEIVFAGGKDETIAKAVSRLMSALASATSVLQT
ncbi:MAG TPA: hypothetical protein VEW74_06265 [Candidatus Nitrosotalea sp.]|nr:hypothetical protein [Candidatus Nitrosotalea sp.]